MRKSYSAGTCAAGEDGVPQLVETPLALAQVGDLETVLEDGLRSADVAGAVRGPRLEQPHAAAVPDVDG